MKILEQAFKKIIENPLILIPSILIIIIGYLASFFGQPLVQAQTGITQLIKIIFFSLLFLIPISACLTWLLILIRPSANKFLKAWSRNYTSILILIFSYNLVQWIIYFVLSGIGKLFSLSEESFRIIFFTLYVLSLLTILLFLTLIPFMATYNQDSWLQIINKSYNKTKSNYLYVGTILLVLFILQSSLAFLPELAAIVLSVVFLPLTAILLDEII